MHLPHKNQVMRAIVLVVPFAILPLALKQDYYIHILIMANVFAINAMGLDLVTTRAGQINLAPALFFGMGAYTSGFLTRLFNVSPWICLPIGGVVATLFGLMIGAPSIKLKGSYLGVVTLATAEIIRNTIITQSEMTGGEEGISGIPSLVRGILPNYYVSLALMLTVFAFSLIVINSKFGLAFRYIAQDELAAQTLGVNTRNYKLIAFMISALVSGIAGSFYAHYNMIAEPTMLSLHTTFLMLIMMIIGGQGTLVGPVIGAYFVTISSELLRAFGAYRLVLYGLLVILIMLFMPGGFMRLKPYVMKLWERLSGSIARDRRARQ